MEKEQIQKVKRTTEEEDIQADELAAHVAEGEEDFEGWFGSNLGGALW